MFVDLYGGSHVLGVHRISSLITHQRTLTLCRSYGTTGGTHVATMEGQARRVKTPTLCGLTRLRGSTGHCRNLATVRIRRVTRDLCRGELVSCPHASDHLLPKSMCSALPPIVRGVLSHGRFQRCTNVISLTTPRSDVKTRSAVRRRTVVVANVRPNGLNQRRVRICALVINEILRAFVPPYGIRCAAISTIYTTHGFHVHACHVLRGK